MKPRIAIFFLATIFGILFFFNTALPDGLLIIEDPPVHTSVSPETARTPAPLTVKYHRVRVTIDNRVAVTSIDQVFKNSYDTDVEGTYIFPLPEEAAIADFTMYINGTRVSGEVLDIMALEESETDDRSSTDTVKYAGDKTFYLRDGIWVDSKYKKGIKVKDIKYLSKKYFNILKNKPGLGKYFATAKNIIVVYDSQCYRVTE